MANVNFEDYRVDPAKLLTVDEAQAMINKFHSNFPGYKEFLMKKKTTATGRVPSDPTIQQIPVTETKPNDRAFIDSEGITDQFTCPESSNIFGAHFRSAEGDTALFVDFKDKEDPTIPRSTYVYVEQVRDGEIVAPLNQDLWNRFKASESKGKFFSAEIRPKFKGQLVWPLGG